MTTNKRIDSSKYPIDSSMYPTYDETTSDIEKITDLSEQIDTLTQLTAGIMETLEEIGQEDFVLLKNKGLSEWWMNYKTLQLKAAEEILIFTRAQTAKHKNAFDQFNIILTEREEEFRKLKEKLKL